MARIFIDGFESGDAHLWDVNPNTPTVYAGPGGGESYAGMTGNYYVGLQEFEIGKYIPERTKIYVRLNFGVQALHGLKIRFYTEHSSLQGWVQISRTSDEIAVHNGLETGGFEETYSYSYDDSLKQIEVCFENIDASQKNIKVRLDDIQILNTTYSNSSPDRTTTDMVKVGDGFFDNVVIDDAEWPGESQIFGLIPTADGSESEWTPMSGESHYEMVNTVPIPTYGSASEWIESNVISDVDLFEMSDVPLGDQDVKSVQAHVYGKMDSVSGETFKVAIRTAGESHYGVSGEYSANFTNAINMWDSNPTTSGEWTMSEVQDIEAGVILI